MSPMSPYSYDSFNVVYSRIVMINLSHFFKFLNSSVLLKSPRDEVYYDFSASEYVASRHLTKTICHRSQELEWGTRLSEISVSVAHVAVSGLSFHRSKLQIQISDISSVVIDTQLISTSLAINTVLNADCERGIGSVSYLVCINMGMQLYMSAHHVSGLRFSCSTEQLMCRFYSRGSQPFLHRGLLWKFW